MDKKTLKIILIGFFIYASSLLSSYFIFSKSALSQGKNIQSQDLLVLSDKKESVVKNNNLVFDQTKPKTEACPLNGALYSKEQRQWWEKHRPLGVMIENHKDARPQSGLSYADVIYEAVAEGGITRFLAVYYCQDAGIIGPVRSARTYFLDYISEYGDFPLYAHVGGANTPGPADSLSQIEKYGWSGYNDLNQFSIGFPVFWRDYDRIGRTVETEHTMYSTTTKLWTLAEKRGLTNVDKKQKAWDKDFVSYKFKEDIDVAKRPDGQAISFDFWKGYSQYSVKWDYDRNNNVYLRSSGGEKHLDYDNDRQLQAKNLVLLFVNEQTADDGYEDNAHLLYDNEGRGKALIFMDGAQTVGSWSKAGRTDRTIIKDNFGNEIEFNSGVMWFEILPIGSEIDVK